MSYFLLISNPLSYLYHLSEPRAQDWQEDTSDTDMVPGLGNPCILSFYQHCDATRDISHRHLVTLQGIRMQIRRKEREILRTYSLHPHLGIPLLLGLLSLRQARRKREVEMSFTCS